MRPSRRTKLLGAVASSFLYLLGIVLVLVVAVDLYYAVRVDATAEFTAADAFFLLFGAALIVAARWVGTRYGIGVTAVPDSFTGSIRRARNQPPEPSKLEQLGYRVPPEPTDASERTTAWEDGTLYRVCDECGANNETDYEYCRECSAPLPE